MIKVADALNSFASVASHVDVPPSEEPVFILTSGQLEAIILQAIERTTAPLEARLENLEDMTARERAYDRQRIAKLEEREKEPGKAEIDKTEELYSHMKLVGLKQTTFSGAAKILQVSKGRVHQLKTAIALDRRFIILPSESHKQRLVIRLREYQKI